MSDALTRVSNRPRWRNAWLDSLVLLFVVSAVNLVVDRMDIGLLAYNPSPYLLIPLIIGFWYGFMPGTIVGLVLMVGLVGIRVAQGVVLEDVFATHGYTLLALPVIGALCGELFQGMRQSRERAEFENAFSSEKLRALGADVDYLRNVKDRLERQLLRQDTLVFSFDNEIRALHETPAESFPSAFLQTLNRTERVYDAALYLAEESGFMRGAFLGDRSFFPDRISSGEDPLVEAVCETGELAALPEFISKGSDAQAGTPYLAGFPLTNSSNDVIGLVLIAGLPFIRFERITLRRIDTFCRWAGQIFEQTIGIDEASCRGLTGHPERNVFKEAIFENRLKLAMRSYENLQVPFTFLLLVNEDGTVSQEKLETLLGGSIRAGDTLCVLDSRKSNLMLLAPFTGERAQQAIDERLRFALTNPGHDLSAFSFHYFDNIIEKGPKLMDKAKELVV